MPTSLSIIFTQRIPPRIEESRSLDERIDAFIDQSPDIRWEIAVLLHEHGHFLLKHPHQGTVDSLTAYQHKVDAWTKGEEFGRTISINDFSAFYADRDKSLLGYRIGLKLEVEEQRKPHG